ncbi:MAG: phosphoribosylaminoimidazolesuccinocarboxamide synthase [Bryobacterales bacterium]|nr:phosphoribosylaminoimidazolesuccinocarboxamide synthase [Bryobacterales bacterium]
MPGATQPVLFESDLPGLQRIARGKVRDIYAFGDRLLIVASDRLSAFDVILPTPIPGKGRVLTQMSVFWFEFLSPYVKTHFLSARFEDFPAELAPFREQLEARSMLVRRARMLPVECVARGYLAGSGWKEYKVSGTVCGIPLPAGLLESSRLPEPIFTPATKAESGHDENIPFERMAEIVGAETAELARTLTLDIYARAASHAESRGIILADTKFEFGWVGDDLVLGDEVLTPDSSRFWPAAGYAPGRAQDSFDKQYVRDYLEGIHWDKRPPAPALPADVAARTADKYREAYTLLTGRTL